MPRDSALRGLRASLVAVWLGTAAVSAFEWQGRSTALLQGAGITDPLAIHAVIGAGIAADLALGLAMWLRPRRAVYGLAIAATLVMTLAATVLQPGEWLHPLGPLLKNLPIVAALAALRNEATT